MGHRRGTQLRAAVSRLFGKKSASFSIGLAYQISRRIQFGFETGQSEIFVVKKF
jgi:hypothetical protein